MRLRIALALAALALVCRPHAAAPLRFATFNIEDFPKDTRQVDAAFAEIERLDASFVAVEEIGDPALFARVAHERLGWKFVSERPTNHDPDHLLGLAYDPHVWQLLTVQPWQDTRVDGREKATLEVRLQHDAMIVRVLVVHLRSGSDGRAIRARQYEGLARILARSRERTIVLGDFNATELADRDSLRRLAAGAGLAWATEDLACSAFWRRADGCPRSRLDHVLTFRAPAHVEAAGACATEGCDAQPTCPLYATQVSDHCPVVVDF